MNEMEFEREMLSKAKAGDGQAKAWICNKYKGLVYKIAKEYKGNRELEDTMQDGYIGLIKAIENYNLNSGYKFMTLLYHYIFGYIMRYKRTGNLIDMPVRIQQNLLKINRALKDKDLIKESNVDTIVKTTGLTKNEVIESIVAQKNFNFAYLEEQVVENEHTDTSYYNLIDTNSINETNILNNIVLKKALKQLETRDRDIVTEIIVNNTPPKELAKRYNTTRQNISLRKLHALKVLRQALQGVY